MVNRDVFLSNLVTFSKIITDNLNLYKISIFSINQLIFIVGIISTGTNELNRSSKNMKLIACLKNKVSSNEYMLS